MRLGLAVACVATLGACTDLVGVLDPAQTEVAVRTTQSVVTAELSSFTDFRVSVELTNFGPRWVVYDRWCGWRIEQLVSGRWIPAYYPRCTAYSTEYFSIPPGSTFFETLPAHATWREGTGAGIEGTYRVVWEIHEELEGPRYVPLREDRTTSNAFSVRR